MSDLIPRDTVEDIVRCRDEALKLYKEASELIARANALVARATSTVSPYNHFSLNRYTLRYVGDDNPHFMKGVRKNVDQYVWRHLFNATSLGDLFDSKRRKEFDQVLEDDPPVVTVDTVVATALTLAASAGDMFDESVHELFRKLRRRFKSHSGFGFGPRIIFEGCMDWCYISSHTEQLIWDMERIVYMLDGKQPPERYGGIVGSIRTFRRENSSAYAGAVEDEYFKTKWYKNGNLHIWILREDIREKMNAVLQDSSILGAGPL